jgi:hypothetical protein
MRRILVSPISWAIVGAGVGAALGWYVLPQTKSVIFSSLLMTGLGAMASLLLDHCGEVNSQTVALPRTVARHGIGSFGGLIVLCGVVVFGLVSRTFLTGILFCGAAAGLGGAVLGYCVLGIEIWRLARRPRCRREESANHLAPPVL